jgi:hypothetical protein
MVRLVFRPYTQVRRSICTSESLRTSTRVSSGFVLPGHSSPSFGYQRVCSYSASPTEFLATDRGAFLFLPRKGKKKKNRTRRGRRRAVETGRRCAPGPRRFKKKKIAACLRRPDSGSRLALPLSENGRRFYAAFYALLSFRLRVSLVFKE